MCIRDRLGGLQFFINGVATGPNITLVNAGVPIIIQHIVNIPSAPVTVQVRGNGLIVTLGANPTISFIQLSTP